MKRLTPKQLAFAEAILDGKTPSDAYRAAYDTSGTPATVKVSASRILAHPAIAEYVAKGREKMAKARLLSRTKKREILFTIACNSKARAAERVKAIEVDNAMTGDNKPVRIEGEITLYSVLKQIAHSTGLPSHDSSQS